MDDSSIIPLLGMRKFVVITKNKHVLIHVTKINCTDEVILIYYFAKFLQSMLLSLFACL